MNVETRPESYGLPSDLAYLDHGPDSVVFHTPGAYGVEKAYYNKSGDLIAWYMDISNRVAAWHEQRRLPPIALPGYDGVTAEARIVWFQGYRVSRTGVPTLTQCYAPGPRFNALTDGTGEWDQGVAELPPDEQYRIRGFMAGIDDSHRFIDTVTQYVFRPLQDAINDRFGLMYTRIIPYNSKLRMIRPASLLFDVTDIAASVGLLRVRSAGRQT